MIFRGCQRVALAVEPTDRFAHLIYFVPQAHQRFKIRLAAIVVFGERVQMVGFGRHRGSRRLNLLQHRLRFGLVC